MHCIGGGLVQVESAIMSLVEVVEVGEGDDTYL